MLCNILKKGETYMSLPEFPKLDDLTFEQSINSILTSIAMEEAALSHILNAEGEKIQYVLANCADVDDVIKTNESVKSLVDSISDLQLTLKSKMRLALSHLPKDKKQHDDCKHKSHDCNIRCCK